MSITSTDGETKFLERPQGYYKAKSDVIVEKVQIPEGTYAIITLTDEEGDGVCCESGAGYFQVYSNQGTLILDEAGTFTTSVSKTFLAAEPETLPPTMSAAPTESAAPTIDSYPITLALQLDQFSSETSLSIVSTDGSQIFFEWPEGTFSGQPSSLVVETVKLPSDIEVTFRITDSGGDGFCKQTLCQLAVVSSCRSYFSCHQPQHSHTLQSQVASMEMDLWHFILEKAPKKKNRFLHLNMALSLNYR